MTLDEYPFQQPAAAPSGLGPRYWHTVNLRTAGDVDADVQDWVTEAYLSSPL